MAVTELPEPASLRKLISYDAETGRLTWLPRTAEYYEPLVQEGSTRGAVWRAAAWNSKFPGTLAGYVSTDGYWRVTVLGTKFLSHRVAWVIHYGSWPSEVDHIDGDRSNFRIANLREVTRSENNKNSSLQCNNTSGVPGVGWCKRTKHWEVRIKSDGEVHRLGRFKDFADAVAARRAGELRFSFHANHGRT